MQRAAFAACKVWRMASSNQDSCRNSNAARRPGGKSARNARRTSISLTKLGGNWNSTEPEFHDLLYSTGAKAGKKDPTRATCSGGALFPPEQVVFRAARRPCVYQKWMMPKAHPARAHVPAVSDQNGTQKSRTIRWRLRS